MGLSFTPLISMNIQEGGQENVAVFCLLSHRSSVAGSTAGQMTEREREREPWRRKREICVCVGFERNCSWLSWIFIPF